METKDAIIKKLTEENHLLREQIKVMAAYIKQLEERIAQLEKNSDNSSKSPSSDLNKPIRVAVRSKVLDKITFSLNPRSQRTQTPPVFGN